MEKYTAIDLFCGAGGLTVGLKKAGFNVLAGVEILDIAASTYELNHKHHKLYRADIRELCPSVIMNDLGIKKGELDLLAGCPPCQGFSTHRTRNKASSVKDDRNNLIFEYLRFIKAMLPKTIMMENVPGLAKDYRIKKLLRELTILGYKVNDDTVKVKDASDYAVPQRRKRMILQASRFGIIKHPKPVKNKKTVYDAISGLNKAGESGDILHDIETIRSPKVENIIKLIPKNGGSRKQIPKKYWLPCHRRNPNSYLDVYGRMSWDDVAPTMTGGCHNPSKGRFIHPEENRAISLREAALLQTFPNKYKFSLERGKDSVALMIGNALPPEFIKRHAKKIYEHLKSI